MERTQRTQECTCAIQKRNNVITRMNAPTAQMKTMNAVSSNYNQHWV